MTTDREKALREALAELWAAQDPDVWQDAFVEHVNSLLAAQPAEPAAEPVAWFVDATQGAELNHPDQKPSWVQVEPGDPPWSDKWKRYPLTAPQAERAALEMANGPIPLTVEQRAGLTCTREVNIPGAERAAPAPARRYVSDEESKGQYAKASLPDAAPAPEPLTDEQIDVCMMLPQPLAQKWSGLERSRYMARRVEKAVHALTAKAAPEPLTEAQIVAGAKVLCRLAAVECGVNVDDNWKVYGDIYLSDMRVVAAVLTADAGNQGGARPDEVDPAVQASEEKTLQRPSAADARVRAALARLLHLNARDAPIAKAWEEASDALEAAEFAK